MEGTAQLAGGGFTTGWNNELLYYANKLTSETDTSQDATIQKYTKKSIGEIQSDFSNGDSGLVEFVRKLAYASRDGAGSVISGSLSAGGAGQAILGKTPTSDAFWIDPTRINVDYSSGGAKVAIQVGAEAGQHIEFQLYQMDAEALGLTDMNVRTVESAGDTINSVKNAIMYVNNVRSSYGAVQNRLEHTIANLDNVVENTSAAESRIRDTDMAKEMVYYANNQILLQAGQSMLAQANHHSDMVLSLLG